MSTEGTPDQDLGARRDIKIVPPVSITPVQDVPQYGGIIFLIMGSTGVGESAFIECLSEGKSLGISRNQLDSVTHSISAYRLDDSDSNTFYLVDTPGFNDQKLSEFRIVDMVREWMKANELDVVARVLYLDKITDIRASGSRGRSLNMLKALTGEHTARNVSFVTTMWDQIWNETQEKRAEERFQQLRTEHWKEYLEDGSQVFRFYNTQVSAIDIINLATNNYVHDDFSFVKAIHEEQPYNETPFRINMYCNLLERVEAIRQRLKSIEEELQIYSSQEQSQSDVEALMDCFRREEEELQLELEILEQDLQDFGSPPREIEEQDVVGAPDSRANYAKGFRQVFRRTREALKVVFHLRK